MGGLTNLLDGFITRRLNQEGVTGAKIDSIADFAFGISIIKQKDL